MFSVKEYFIGYPSQLDVANLMLMYGIRLQGGVPYIGPVKQSDS